MDWRNLFRNDFSYLQSFTAKFDYILRCWDQFWWEGQSSKRDHNSCAFKARVLGRSEPDIGRCRWIFYVES